MFIKTSTLLAACMVSCTLLASTTAAVAVNRISLDARTDASAFKTTGRSADAALERRQLGSTPIGETKYCPPQCGQPEFKKNHDCSACPP
ncbi:hypothetical protein IE81DRAFT_48165 [Ceraceosorus guamensis]|uniref:Uncharacterized protein n=1 Tax=Ceraceosorus guamensis TaxID=1522189 RepID=A0A316W2J4_9BASI|nr:hypothetical protein IE81DRAFT_48165 [Ceraceosorus guamensis]PWN44117.1 hypothetical protein IE81DRAFT_48165 [Ceraceosorus guamensis]